MKNNSINGFVTTNIPLSPYLKAQIRRIVPGITRFVVSENQPVNDTGFPFAGYPNKYKKELWEEWEKRVEKAGFCVDAITPEMAVDRKYARLASRFYRESDDESARKSKNGVTISPNSYEVGFD